MDMKKETKQNEPKEKMKKKNRKLLIRSGLATLLLAVIVIGITYAWFVKDSSITTLIEVAEPTKISIRGPHGSEMTELDLSYNKKSDKNEDGSVTIRRVISIRSAENQHQLEVIHTTNLKGLSFQIYAAQETDAGGDVTQGGHSYTYTRTPLDGKYLNRDTAKSSGDYNYATDALHGKNYDSGDLVQAHAEPLYWLSGTLDADVDNKETADSEYSLTYYVLEITWTETTKETDIFYLLAKNA